jgi:hypothetical protein
MANAIVVGLPDGPYNAQITLPPGTLVRTSTGLTGEVGAQSKTGYLVHEPGTRTSTPASAIDIPTAQLQLVFTHDLSVLVGGVPVMVQDTSHVVPDVFFWEANCQTFASSFGRHSGLNSLTLLALIDMEMLVLGLGVIATGRYLSSEPGCPMELKGGGFGFGANRRTFFQYRLVDKHNDHTAYHFHGMVQGTKLAELAWHAYVAGETPRPYVPGAENSRLMSVAQFTKDAADLGLDKSTHVIDMTSVWADAN